MPKYLFLLILFAACSGAVNDHKHAADAKKKKADSARVSLHAAVSKRDSLAINDTLNTIAGLIAGNATDTTIFNTVASNQDYLAFSESFSRRWKTFDSSRISRVKDFTNRELNNGIKSEKTLFYPFSGPDILYANLFFPNVEKYVMIGLEPVGTLPHFEREHKDSLNRYYNKLNVSLNAILNFSFFRTESMNNDLRNAEVDGTIHLLFLFLNRTGNAIVSAKPITVDSVGNTVYMPSFEVLKAEHLKTKGVDIQFKTPGNQLRQLIYFSVNAADYNLQNNPGFKSYLNHMDHFNVYLKGASYLLHKPNFNFMRNMILNKSTTIIQDDSGIALRYFYEDMNEWQYQLYGQYSKPIHMFANHYQPLLDTLYDRQGAKHLDFGLGYNYRDKNSNFMVITKKN